MGWLEDLINLEKLGFMSKCHFPSPPGAKGSVRNTLSLSSGGQWIRGNKYENDFSMMSKGSMARLFNVVFCNAIPHQAKPEGLREHDPNINPNLRSQRTYQVRASVKTTSKPSFIISNLSNPRELSIKIKTWNMSSIWSTDHASNYKFGVSLIVPAGKGCVYVRCIYDCISIYIIMYISYTLDIYTVCQLKAGGSDCCLVRFSFRINQFESRL